MRFPAISIFPNEQFRPQTTYGKYTTPDPTSSSYSSGQDFYTVVRNYITYNKNFGHNNHLNVFVGHSNLSKSSNVSASRSDFPSNNVQSISSGDPSTARKQW